MMEWSIQSNSANILSHLRDLGYPVPTELVNHYQNQLQEYLFAEYPLRVVPKFTYLELTEPEVSFDEFSLDEWEMEPLKVIDSRPTLEVSKTFHLFWKDIGLTCFPPSFLDQTPLPVDFITHIDLSYNHLTSVPVQFFQLQNLELLNIAHNQITSLPRIELWNTKSKLQILNASHNAIFIDSQSPVLYRKHRNSSQPFNHLWYIDLGHNRLTCFPQWVVHLPALKHLNIQHNPKVKEMLHLEQRGRFTHMHYTAVAAVRTLYHTLHVHTCVQRYMLKPPLCHKYLKSIAFHHNMNSKWIST